MQIIEVKHAKEVPGLWCGFVCEPSVDSAVQQYVERYGVTPSVVYFKQTPKGRMAIYIPIETGGGND